MRKALSVVLGLTIGIWPAWFLAGAFISIEYDVYWLAVALMLAVYSGVNAGL